MRGSNFTHNFEERFMWHETRARSWLYYTIFAAGIVIFLLYMTLSSSYGWHLTDDVIYDKIIVSMLFVGIACAPAYANRLSEGLW